MKKYIIVEDFGNGNLKEKVKYYDASKAKLRKANFEKVYPKKKYKVLILNN